MFVLVKKVCFFSLLTSYAIAHHSSHSVERGGEEDEEEEEEEDEGERGKRREKDRGGDLREK